MIAVSQTEIILISDQDYEDITKFLAKKDFNDDEKKKLNYIKKFRFIDDPETFGEMNLDKEPRMCRQKTKRMGSYNINIFRSLPCLFDETMNFFYPVVGEYKNHDKEELRMSLNIAKNNVKIDDKNKYYLDLLNNIQNKWDSLYGKLCKN